FQREQPDTLFDRVVINETAAALMGLNEPAGKTISFGTEPIIIEGVVKDFHSNSIHQAIRPLVIFHIPEDAEELAIRYQPGAVEDAIDHLKASYLQFAPNSTSQFEFLDKEYEELYESELLIGTLAGFFAFIAMLISCLGLLGLIGFIAKQKTKEIGVRKVLGASVFSIVVLLSRDLLRLVAVAFLIAVPITWYFMRDWLGNFAYGVQMNWWVFLLAGLGALGIAFLTMCLHSIRAATADPIKSLRND
ncbi:MAG: FtsX-like permease family protein, partial [Bacteroidota bacterium]